MLTATGKNGRINAWEATKSDGPFTCPGCHWSVILKAGMFKVTHFAHEPGADCPYAAYQRGESEEHLGAKKDLFTALSGCEGVTDLKLERYLGPVRPDVSFRLHGVPVAIEMQISNIDAYTIARRTKEYSRRGIYLLWLSRWSDVSEDIKDGQMFSGVRAWERYIHYVLYKGRLYYWVKDAIIRPVHFEEEQAGYTDDPLLIIRQAMARAHFQPERHITKLGSFSVSVQYTDLEPIQREAKLWGIPTIWVSQDRTFLSVHEACKRYPGKFFEPSQLILPPDVKPFDGDPFDDTAPVDPGDFLDLPPGMPAKCPRHNHLYRNSDRFGTYYCNHPECWSRYRLLLLGQDLEYPEIIAVFDPRDYLSDLSATPIYRPSPYHDSRLILPIYPTRPPVTGLLINAGEQSWRVFAGEQPIDRIALALKTIDQRLRKEEKANG